MPIPIIDVSPSHVYPNNMVVTFREPCPGCGHKHEHSMARDAKSGRIEGRVSHCQRVPKPGYGPRLESYSIRLNRG